MQVSVVILSFNHPELTSRAVLSAQRLNCSSIILVHNGSLEKHVALLKERFANIEHLLLSPNRGYGAGVNYGLAAAFLKTPWAILLTNDSELLNLPSLPEEPCQLGPKIFRRKTEQVDAIGALFYPARAHLRHCRVKSEFDTARRVRRYIPGTCFLLHREIFERTGPLNEGFHLYWDDVEYSQRVVEAGFPLHVTENWQVRHGMSKTGQSDPLYSLYYFQRNRKLVSWQFTPWYLKANLLLRLSLHWAKLFSKLVKQRRYSALTYLRQAIFKAL